MFVFFFVCVWHACSLTGGWAGRAESLSMFAPVSVLVCKGWHFLFLETRTRSSSWSADFYACVWVVSITTFTKCDCMIVCVCVCVRVCDDCVCVCVCACVRVCACRPGYKHADVCLTLTFNPLATDERRTNDTHINNRKHLCIQNSAGDCRQQQGQGTWDPVSRKRG
jgi:hypothetical protein